MRETENLICPACDRAVPTLGASGVCTHCHKSFGLAHSHWISGKRPRSERPERPSEHFTDSAEHFTDGGETCESEDFDMASVEAALGEWHEAPDDVRAEAGNLLARIFAHTWTVPDGRGMIKTALAKFSGFFLAVRPDLIAASYREAGEQIGLTKQLVSHAVLKAEQAFKFKSLRTRPLAARENMRLARQAQVAAGKPHPRIVAKARREALAKQGKGLALAGQGTPDPGKDSF